MKTERNPVIGLTKQLIKTSATIDKSKKEFNGKLSFLELTGPERWLSENGWSGNKSSGPIRKKIKPDRKQLQNG